MAQALDIAPLRSVVAVADCGGFHRAAAALHLTQSAVSQHLRKIEGVLGGPVVERSGRGVVFTELGQRVLRHARTILAAHDSALDDLGATDRRLLVIGATERGADVMLPGLTGALREWLPDWRLRFRLDRNVSLADAIERGLVDLAVMLDGSGFDRNNASGVVGLKWISSRTFSAPAGQPLPLVIFAEPCTLREPAVRARGRAAADDRPADRRSVSGRGSAGRQPGVGVCAGSYRYRSDGVLHGRCGRARRAGGGKLMSRS